MNIEMRHQRMVNTDPQRRCYDGCNFSEELQWGAWDTIDFNLAEDRVEARLKFWRDLNDYAISARGEGARSEFRAVAV